MANERTAPLSKNLPSVEADGQQMLLDYTNAIGKTPGRAPLVLVGCILKMLKNININIKKLTKKRYDDCF